MFLIICPHRIKFSFVNILQKALYHLTLRCIQPHLQYFSPCPFHCNTNCFTVTFSNTQGPCSSLSLHIRLSLLRMTPCPSSTWKTPFHCSKQSSVMTPPKAFIFQKKVNHYLVDTDPVDLAYFYIFLNSTFLYFYWLCELESSKLQKLECHYYLKPITIHHLGLAK